MLAVLDGRSLARWTFTGCVALRPTTSATALAAELSFGGAAGIAVWMPDRCCCRSRSRRDRDLHVLLLVGAYQLLYSRIPPHAAVSAWSRPAVVWAKSWASKLVNGVLRRLQRERGRWNNASIPNAATRLPSPTGCTRPSRRVAGDQGVERILTALQGGRRWCCRWP